MMNSVNVEQIIDAYLVLKSRCLTESATWLLDFIHESDLNIQITPKPQSIKIEQAQNYFFKSEFKKTQCILQNNTDQTAIGISLLAKILDTQRQLQQFVSEDTTFIGNLPVITNQSHDIYKEILRDIELKTDGYDPLNKFLYASILSRSGQYFESIEPLVESIQQFPFNRSAWRLLLSTLLRFDDSKISPIIDKLPKHWMTDIFHIELLSELQQGEEAVKCFEELNLPRTSAIIALEATINYNRRTFERANVLFTELRQKHPYKVESMELFSNMLFVQGNLSALSELAQTFSKIDKFRPETLCIIGNLFSLSEKHEDAIEQFSLALRFDPNFNFAWTLIGHEYVEISNFSAATAAYTKAYEANPRDYRAIYGLGRAFQLTGYYYHAIVFYRKAVVINPFDSRMWMAIGECYESISEIQNAIKCFQRAVCNADNDGIALIKLAKLSRDNNDIDRAAFCFETFLTKHKSDDTDGSRKDDERDAIHFLANYYKKRKNKEKALYFAQIMLQDSKYSDEGKAIIKDVNLITND